MYIYIYTYIHNNDSLHRQAALKPGTAEPAKWNGRARRGRPRQTWTACIHQHVLKAFGTTACDDDLVAATLAVWERKVAAYVSRLDAVDDAGD